jgi:hypothetical protein
MPGKTHQTAAAIVPPQDVWGRIHTIPERDDRQFSRWPPHVNLLYPYFPPEWFDGPLPRLFATCAQIAPSW